MKYIGTLERDKIVVCDTDTLERNDYTFDEFISFLETGVKPVNMLETSPILKTRFKEVGKFFKKYLAVDTIGSANPRYLSLKSVVLFDENWFMDYLTSCQSDKYALLKGREYYYLYINGYAYTLETSIVRDVHKGYDNSICVVSDTHEYEFMKSADAVLSEVTLTALRRWVLLQ